MTRPELRSPEYAGGEPRAVREFEIFLSSGSDLDEQRVLFKELAQAFNEQALDAGTDYRIAIRAWEGAVTRRTFNDGNREFRYDAAHANLVVVLVHRELRRGTEEELDRALRSPDVQTAIIWMDPPPPDSRKAKEKKLLAKMDKIKDKVRWFRTDQPGHKSVVIAMVSILARLLVHMASPHAAQQAGDYTEAR
jgi:hypothetical protein